MSVTPTQQLATLKLGTDVVQWVKERRNAHPRPSYRSIATDLRDLTAVDVTDETVRLWALLNPEQAAS